MYKAVIFDFFDVVHRDHQKAWFGRHGYERSGAFAEASRMLDLGHIDYDEYIGMLASASGQSMAEIKRQFDEFATLDDGTVQIINDLRKKKYKTGLLSNSNTGELRPILSRHELEPLFDQIIVSGEEKMAKPDPGVFSLMLNRLGLKAEQCIFTDDNLGNIEAASSLNIYTIHFESAKHLRHELIKSGLLTA
jgi:2-haloacid dehalogenase